LGNWACWAFNINALTSVMPLALATESPSSSVHCGSRNTLVFLVNLQMSMHWNWFFICLRITKSKTKSVCWPIYHLKSAIIGMS
jgi:hypothetical protein